MGKQENLIYKISDIEGVPIDVLCGSLKAIENEFRRFTNDQRTLLVKEVRKGSGIFEFFEKIAIPTLAIMGDANTVLQFAEYLGTVVDILLKKKEKLPNDAKLTPTTISNVNTMFAPVINGNGNTLNFYVGQQQQPAISVGQSEYKEIEKESGRKLKELKSEKIKKLEDQVYNKVLFQWVQTRFDSTNVGNRGVIKRIQDKPVKVVFADDNSSAKTEMTTSSLGVDWQKVKYIVDVETLVGNDNQVSGYKILKNYPNDSITETGNDSELF